MSNSKKISAFTQQTSYQSGDLITIVRGSDNFTVDASALAAFLGVTGTITPVANPDAAVLEQLSSTVNRIRGFEDGLGTQVGLTARNNVKTDHNFVNGAAGVGVIQDVTSSQTLFRSLLAGTGISVGISGDSIQITATAGTQSTKTVLISQESDFPTPSGGVITLADDTDYLLLQDISTANRFVVGMPSVVRAADSSIASLTYTGSGNMFTGVDADFKLTKFTANCPSGTLFDVTGGIAQMIDMTVGECDEIGTFTNIIAGQINNVAWSDIKTDGMTFVGNMNFFTMLINLVTLNGGTFLDLGASTVTGFNVAGCFSTLAAGTTFLDGAASSANINSGGLGALDNNRFSGAGTALATITSDDALWNFSINDDIQDTRTDGLLSMQANATETVIAVAGTPVLVAGTWTIERVSQMTGTTAGRLTLDAEKTSALPITASLTVAPVSGAAVDVSIEIAIDGTVVANSKRTASASAASSASITIPWQESMDNAQFIEVFATNEDSTVNLLVSSATFRVN
ncbi:hypothetical protein KAR91_46315 [Candidatus Pacearchaeota archaeon]|nr:hypothetical protein [Candidatus Pacearchaeota archaeon]